MPWANGMGTTAQIDLFLANSPSFLWRLSAATVSGDNTFSSYPGLQRILVVWKGQGLWLNEDKLETLVPYSFSGDALVKCRLIQDEVLDLGLIYDPLRIIGQMKVLNLSQQNLTLNLPGGVHYLVAAQGDFRSDPVFVSEGDTLKIEGPGAYELAAASSGAACLIAVTLTPVTPIA